MHLPKITISPNAFRVNGQELTVMHDPEPTINHIGSNIYGVTVTIPSDDIDLDADARYTDETEFEANNVNPLHTPAGTPFLATVCGGLPQLVVRSHSDIDLEAVPGPPTRGEIKTDSPDFVALKQRLAKARKALP
ncbi:TPA: hypothetical protein NJV08_002196 [Corynebacterium striatum]|nr:hypothetical protein [Corynebacterium striatum]HCG2979448.1 hypothetical protein [Corynebacterium striatum]HCG2992830.1 hypothetical protein [Corynebacterium striatum]HCG2995484.1 hypothetical protein [Corynebacterium striatum]HCH2243549.1 hypothetical protein [Corynebacterium striatum]